MFHCAERVDFDAIFSFGNIYFASDAVKDAVPAEIISDIPQELKEKAAGIFTFGSSAERDFWKKERLDIKINRGPCSSISSYTGHPANGLFRVKSIRLCSVLGRREVAWIVEYATPKAPDDPLLASAAQNDPEAHTQLLEKYLAVAPYLLDINKRLVRSALWHTDLHSSNLLVDKGHITAVIDWQ